jgi:glycosyltransferase involved in cell wall biosynthesis
MALLRRANSIVATSPIYATTSHALKNFLTKITIVPIGISDVKLLANNRSDTSSLEDRINGKKIILSVGRLVSYKGFDVLIDAVRYLSTDSVVVIVGEGALYKVFLNAIKDAGIQDRIVLAGRLSQAALHLLFQSATIFCLPSISRAEAFGVVLLEAMSYGVPIVATDIPGSGVPWVNQHGVSGFNVKVGDSQALADACNEILGSIELRDKFSKGARQRFVSEFTDEIAVGRMMDIYKLLATR